MAIQLISEQFYDGTCKTPRPKIRHIWYTPFEQLDKVDKSRIQQGNIVA